MRRKEMFTVLDGFKKFVGLSDYKIFISTEYQDIGEAFAEEEVNILEKTIKIRLSKAFKKETKESQISKLIHELIHARIDIYNQTLLRYQDEHEEYLANDLERGFYELYRGAMK